MTEKKKFFEKKQNKNTLFISLFVALIIFMVEILVWAIEYTANLFFNIVGYESSTFAHGLGLIVAIIFLAYFTFDTSKRLDL